MQKNPASSFKVWIFHSYSHWPMRAHPRENRLTQFGKLLQWVLNRTHGSVSASRRQERQKQYADTAGTITKTLLQHSFAHTATFKDPIARSEQLGMTTASKSTSYILQSIQRLWFINFLRWMFRWRLFAAVFVEPALLTGREGILKYSPLKELSAAAAKKQNKKQNRTYMTSLQKGQDVEASSGRAENRRVSCLICSSSFKGRWFTVTRLRLWGRQSKLMWDGIKAQEVSPL